MNQTYEKVPDNMESDFPARMSDGRQFTDYRQNCLLNNNIAQGKMSWEYRYYLERNADEIHNMFLENDKSKYECKSCSDNTLLPVQTIINCKPTGCTYSMNDPMGLGQDRNVSTMTNQ